MSVPPARAPATSPTGGSASPTLAQDVWQAAEWVATNVPIAAIVATDNPDSLEVPALTGHRTYLSGYRYQVGLGDSASAAQVPVRTEISWGTASGPGDGRLAALCDAGVGWLWLAPGCRRGVGRCRVSGLPEPVGHRAVPQPGSLFHGLIGCLATRGRVFGMTRHSWLDFRTRTSHG